MATASTTHSTLGIVKDIFFIAAGIASATLGLEGFLLPNGFLDGGVTGISLLAGILSGGNISIFIALLNVPFIIIAARQFSIVFAIKTLCAILAFAGMLTLVEMAPITTDKLLTAVFGGIFLGAGIGLCVRGGCVIDGTEVLAVYCAKRFGVGVGDVIIVLNVAIFSAAAALLNIETAMYSMLTYAAASKAIDFLISGIEEYVGLTIISAHAEEIHSHLTQTLGKAVTIYKGGAGYATDAERMILFCIVTRLEVSRISSEVERLDGHAFITQHTINHIRGGMVKKRPLHD